MQNKTIFITGTSSGIGRATVRYFVEKGWNVVATMRNPEVETEFKDGERLILQKVDVTDSVSIKLAFENGIKKFGKIDVVVNNAGYGLLGPLELTTEEQVKKQFDTNVFGVVNVSRVAISHFREVGEGKIVNVSSMVGMITLPFFTMYSATKFAVEGLSEDLYYELRDFNIQVKLIEPGTINTDFFGKSLARAESETVKVYDKYWHHVIDGLIQRGKNGADPTVAAKVIYKAVNDSSNRLRYRVDILSKFLVFVRHISPLPLFRFIISKAVR